LKLHIALVQLQSRLGDVEYNVGRHIAVLDELKSYKPNIVCFPELSLTGYMIKDLAYELAGSCLEGAKRISKYVQDKQRVIVGAIVENKLGLVHNAAIILEKDKMTGVVKKFYLPTYGLFEEMKYFTSGNPVKDIMTFELDDSRFGVVICEDAWHPEPIECLARLGAHIVFCISSSPVRGVHRPRDDMMLPIEDQWLSIIKAHAIMNGIYMAFVNRAGPEDEEYFWGGSALVSPYGEILARGRRYEPDLVTYEIETDEVARARRFSSFREHKVGFHEILRKL